MAVAALGLIAAGHAAFAQTATWTSTTAERPWVTADLSAADPNASGANVTKITIDPQTTYQTIDGFGGCFNETGWKALGALSELDRASVMQALFNPKTGCRFTFGRMPIGASDFGLDWYSLDDTPNDYELKYFTNQRDKGNLIPYIHAAMKYAPKLQIWGSAWSPPAWLKNNNDYHGGDNTLKQDPQTLDTYARYLAKYVQAYRKAGVPVYAVHVQNEPASSQNFPSCEWTGELERLFIRDYLGPRFAK
ncbi:MAG: glycosyl hydrolase, partial [Capsulimonas sp.]|nr:glycosyl hydrolase [Capsulimonas sp.]